MLEFTKTASHERQEPRAAHHAKLDMKEENGGTWRNLELRAVLGVRKHGARDSEGSHLSHRMDRC